MRRHLLAACAVLIAATQSVAAAGTPIHVGELGILADAPFYIALDQGYFAKQDLDVRLDQFDSASQGSPALATNQIQVLGGGVSASLFNAFARGWPVAIAMARTRDMPGFSSDSIVRARWPRRYHQIGEGSTRQENRHQRSQLVAPIHAGEDAGGRGSRF